MIKALWTAFCAPDWKSLPARASGIAACLRSDRHDFRLCNNVKPAPSPQYVIRTRAPTRRCRVPVYLSSRRADVRPEDSVALREKDAARRLVYHHAPQHPLYRVIAETIVRVNALDLEWGVNDLKRSRGGAGRGAFTENRHRAGRH